jgi:hypothetical protein
MSDHAPDALVGDANVPGDGLYRHLTGQKHDRLLEKQREAAPFTSPRDIHSVDAVLGTFDAWNPGLDQAMVLEEVEMPPSELLEIMGLAKSFALRARICRSAIRLNLKPQLAGLLFQIQRLTDHLPGFSKAESQRKKIIRIHRQSLPLEVLSYRTVGVVVNEVEFHTPRRGTLLLSVFTENVFKDVLGEA